MKHNQKGQCPYFSTANLFSNENCHTPCGCDHPQDIYEGLSCVISNILYNCETFGRIIPKDLEKCYCSLLKSCLGIRKNVPNDIVLIVWVPTLRSIGVWKTIELLSKI